MTRETRIGLLALASILLFIFGFQFLKGKNILSRAQTFYVRYDNVDLLKTSDPVVVNGFQVGLVQSVAQDPENLNKLIVTLYLEADIQVPDETVAEINTTSVMGGKAVMLRLKGNCCKESGDFLEGRTLGMLSSMVGSEELEDYMHLISGSLQNLADTLLAKFSDSEAMSGTGEDLQAIVSNLRTSTASLNRMLATNSALNQTLENVSGITGNLNENGDNIDSLLANINRIAADLQAARLSETVNGLNATMASLQTTLQQADEALAGIAAITESLKSTDSTLGLLLNDRELHDQLDITLENLELLLQDVRLNPKRYTRILSKKEKPYEPPVDDPGIEEGN